MDGKILRMGMLHALDEDSVIFSNNWLPYRFLNIAAVNFVRLTGARKKSATISTVAYQEKYDLPPDFISLYMRNDDRAFFIKYFDGDDYYWPVNKPDREIYKDNLIASDPDVTVTGTDIAFVDSDPDTITSTSTDFDAAGFVAGMTITTNALGNIGPFTIETVAANTLTLVTADAVTTAAAGSSVTIESCTTLEQPAEFAIIDKETKPSLITGTATSDGAASGDESTLTDTAATFTGTELVYPRAMVHNETDGSDGIVLSVTSGTVLVTALFGGTNDDWTSGDAYTIQPNPVKQIYLDAPSRYANHIMTIPYLAMPAPVYSDYGFWNFAEKDCQGICFEAASLYKASKGDLEEAGRLHALFLEYVGQERTETARHGSNEHIQFQPFL